MGVIIKGTDDTVKAADGSLSIEGFSIKTTGIGTFDGGIQVGSAATVSANGNATFSGIVTTAQLGGDVLIEDKIVHAGDTNTTIRFPSADTISVENGGSESFRVDSSGRLLIGHTANVAAWGVNSTLQVLGANANDSTLVIGRYEANAFSGNLLFTKSRNGTIGSQTIVQDDDEIGTIGFNASDGTDLANASAYIQGRVDGTPGSNDTPGRLAFFTTPDGSGTATERLRISADGGVKLTGHSERSINALGNTTGSTTIDFTTADIITATLTGTTTFANPTTESVGQSGSIVLTQDGTGSRTASWGSQFKWVGGTAPTLTTTAAAVDRIDYLVVAADTIHCVASLDVK